MKKAIKEFVFKYWILLFFGCLALIMALTKVSPRELWRSLRSLALWQISLLMAIYFTLSGLNVLLRKYLLNSLGVNPRLKNLWLIHFTSMAAHYSTPAKLGFPVTVLLLKKLENINYSVGTAALFIELVISTAICGLIGMIGTTYCFSGANRIPIFLGFVLSLTSMILVARWVKSSRPSSRFGKSLARLSEALKSLSAKKLITYSIMRISVQFCVSINLFLLCRFFSADISYLQAVVISSSAFFIGAMSMIPMGLGVREGSVLLYLAKLGTTGPSAISVVTIQRVISTGLSFALGAIFGSIIATKGLIKVDKEN